MRTSSQSAQRSFWNKTKAARDFWKHNLPLITQRVDSCHLCLTVGSHTYRSFPVQSEVLFSSKGHPDDDFNLEAVWLTAGVMRENQDWWWTWQWAPKNHLWVWRADRIGAAVVSMETGLGKSVTKVKYEDFNRVQELVFAHVVYIWSALCHRYLSLFNELEVLLSFPAFCCISTATSDPSWYFAFSPLTHSLFDLNQTNWYTFHSNKGPHLRSQIYHTPPCLWDVLYPQVSTWVWCFLISSYFSWTHGNVVTFRDPYTANICYAFTNQCFHEVIKTWRELNWNELKPKAMTHGKKTPLPRGPVGADHHGICKRGMWKCSEAPREKHNH